MKDIIICLLIAACLASCSKKNIAAYEGSDSIYFTPAADNTAQSRKDSLAVSFAFSYNATDSVIKIPVAVLGRTAAVDRPYTVRVIEGGSAKEGIHYDLVVRQSVIKAGSLTDSFQVILHRTDDLKTNEVQVNFELVPNAYFLTEMRSSIVNSAGKVLHFTRFRLFSNDILPKPESWLDFYLGDFTEKKFYLLGEILNIDLDVFSGPAFQNVTFEEVQYYGITMQRYLNSQRAAGHTVYEKDDSEMIMGIGVQ